MSIKLELNSEYIVKLKTLIKNDQSKKLIENLNTIHTADIAEIIEILDTKEAQYLYKLIADKERLAAIIIELDDETREKLLEDLTANEIANVVIDKLATDDAANVIGEFSNDKKEEVLAQIKDEVLLSNINDLLSYPSDTAGSIMEKELIKVNENWHTIKCLKEMRNQANDLKNIYTIYVVNDEDKLLGLMSLRKLLLTEKSTAIKDIMNENIISVHCLENNENVANMMQKYNLVTIPVIDNMGKLIGRITFDDIMDVAKEEAEKDYQLASGISEDVESSDTILTLTRARLPWLLIGMFGGILGAGIIGLFDLRQNFELAFFIPLIAAMGGNVGVQSAAIVVQGLAKESLKMENIFQKLLKELFVGLLNGIICSVIILGSSLALGYGILLSATVSISLLAVVVFAAIFGTLIPLTLEKYNIDPALATGPFITTINDVLGLFIYFYIGQAIL
jgi:magnesium transporter